MPEPKEYGKQCPKCAQPALIDAGQCERCGHVYRTKFGPPTPSPLDRTVAFRADWAPAPTSTSQQPTRATPPAATTNSALSETRRQYEQLVRWQQYALVAIVCGPVIWGASLIISAAAPGLALAALLLAGWLLFSGVLSFISLVAGIVMIVMVMTRKPTLRMKIADAGIDATAWAAPLDQPLRRTLLASASVSGGAIAACIVFISIAHLSQRPPASTQFTSDGQMRAQQQALPPPRDVNEVMRRIAEQDEVNRERERQGLSTDPGRQSTPQNGEMTAGEFTNHQADESQGHVQRYDPNGPQNPEPSAPLAPSGINPQVGPPPSYP